MNVFLLRLSCFHVLCSLALPVSTQAFAYLPSVISVPRSALSVQRAAFGGTTALFSASSNNRQDNSDEYIPSKRAPPQGGDMAYIQTNIQRQMNTYQQIRQVSLDSIRDVYVRQPRTRTFWYIGKVAMAGVSLEQAMGRQANLMEEHATRLRPVELGRSFGNLEYFVAPGDSELACTKGTVDLIPVLITKDEGGFKTVPLKAVGFYCEVVTNQGIGLHIEREMDGTVAKPYQ